MNLVRERVKIKVKRVSGPSDLGLGDFRLQGLESGEFKVEEVAGRGQGCKVW